MVGKYQYAETRLEQVSVNGFMRILFMGHVVWDMVYGTSVGPGNSVFDERNYS